MGAGGDLRGCCDVELACERSRVPAQVTRDKDGWTKRRPLLQDEKTSFTPDSPKAFPIDGQSVEGRGPSRADECLRAR